MQVQCRPGALKPNLVQLLHLFTPGSRGRKPVLSRPAWGCAKVHKVLGPTWQDEKITTSGGVAVLPPPPDHPGCVALGLLQGKHLSTLLRGVNTNVRPAGDWRLDHVQPEGFRSLTFRGHFLRCQSEAQVWRVIILVYHAADQRAAPQTLEYFSTIPE